MKLRWLVSILLIIVVAAVIIGSVVYRRVHRSEPGPTITLAEYPKYVTSPTVVLRGHVSRVQRIDIIRDTTTVLHFPAGNEFEAEVQLEPGENQIRLVARDYGVIPTQSETLAVITWEPKHPPTPTINPLPPNTNLPLITITGTTYPNAHVRITVAPEVTDIAENQSTRSDPPAAKAKSPPIAWENAEAEPLVHDETAGKDGSFETKLRLTVAGPYTVSSRTYNSEGTTSDASADVKFVYDPHWYPTSVSVQSPTSRRVIRTANILLAHKQMTVTLAVSLPRDDPAVTALLANRVTVEDFFDKIFEFRLNNQSYSEFQDAVPQIAIKDREATITVTTAPDYRTRNYLPVLWGELTLQGSNDFPFSSSDDSLTIQTYDYNIESVGPPPTSFDKNTLTWIGTPAKELNVPGDARIIGGSEREIKLRLAYKPFASPGNLLRLAQISPYNLWQYPVDRVPQILIGFCRLIPMLWVLWLFADSPLKTTVDADLRNDVIRLSRLLIILSLVDTLANLSWMLGFLSTRPEMLREILMKFIWVTVPVLSAFSSLGIVLLALLCRLLASRVSHRTGALWLTWIATAAAKAALVCVPLVLTWYLNSFSKILVRTVSGLSIAIALGLFSFRTAKVLRHGSLNPRQRVYMIVFALVVELTFVVPIAAPTSDVWAPWIIYQSFSMLQSLLPYAVATALLIVLKKVNMIDQSRVRHLVLSIGLILFSAYLVGVTSNLFMIPIPFILSIWMFRNFLIHGFRKCGDLDLVNNEVVRDRRRLIGGVLAYDTAQYFQIHIEKLRDQVVSGDMTLKDFEDRKAEIEKYAHDKEVASTHANGLHAKTTVLSVGPNTRDWMNGKWCLKWGAFLMAPFLVAYLSLLLFGPTRYWRTVFDFVFGFNQILTFIADGLLAAFFFGYYFRYIRGSSGLEKGLRTACAVIVCLLPTWLTGVSSRTNLIGVFFNAGQIFLFFTLLGMGAFDYATFRNALRDEFRWRTFARFGNMPSFTAVVSVLITSVGVGVTSVITGQFAELLKNLLKAAFQQAPGPPSL